MVIALIIYTVILYLHEWYKDVGRKWKQKMLNSLKIYICKVVKPKY